MNDRPKPTFSRRVRAAEPRDQRYEVRDDTVQGLMLRIFPSGARTFTLASMVRGRRRYATLGNADSMTIPEARREARKLIARYIEPAKTGNGPLTPGYPMIPFAEEFLDRQARLWKPNTRNTNASIMRKEILPAFGDLTVDAITVEQVRDWFASMSDRPGIANRAMPMLSVMMRMAELWGYRRHNTNPCKNTRRYKMKPIERSLTAEEMTRLNPVLARNEFWCPHIVAVVRLLMLTGCRRSEVLNLRWHDIGPDTLKLRDSKTGPRTVPLGEAARAHIGALPGAHDPEAFLFPRYAEARCEHSLIACWQAVCADAKLGRLRLHDLRHTAASHAVMAGENLSLVGKLLGHKRHRTTADYAHLADGHLVEAAEKVGAIIEIAIRDNL